MTDARVPDEATGVAADEEVAAAEVAGPPASSAREGVEEVPAEDIQRERADDLPPDEVDAL